jgi:hypothetical protein
MWETSELYRFLVDVSKALAVATNDNAFTNEDDAARTIVLLLTTSS